MGGRGVLSWEPCSRFACHQGTQEELEWDRADVRRLRSGDGFGRGSGNGEEEMRGEDPKPV